MVSNNVNFYFRWTISVMIYDWFIIIITTVLIRLMI